MKKGVLLLVSILMCGFTLLKAQTDSIDVQHYTIDLNIDNIIKGGHCGSTTVTFNLITDNYRKVQFDLLSQTVDSVYTGNASVNEPLRKTEFTYDGKKLTFSLPDYPVKENYTAIVYYHGSSTVENNSRAWGGLHYDADIIYSMGVAFADYPHTYARSWFVCHDIFTDKASFDFNISVDKDKEAFCSGNLTAKQEHETFDTYKYSLPQKIAPYLAAVTVGKFFTYTKNVHSKTYGYDIPLVVKYVYADDSVNIAHNFSGIEDAFNALEQHFGRFRFNRIGYCVTPKGSMEHVDNISLSRGVILDTSIDAVSNIVHELGHSWFGNLATCENEKDMWLNEGWTTYTTSVSLEAIYGKDRLKEYWDKKHRWVLESLPQSEGHVSVYGIDSSMTYSSTVYEKGSMVAKTFQGYFGDSVFFVAVKAMLDSFQFANYNSYQVRDFLCSYTKDAHFAEFFNHLVFEDKQINYDMYKKADGSIGFTFSPSDYTGLVNIPVTYINDEPFADIDNTLMTLTTDCYKNIKTAGMHKMDNTYSYLYVRELEDSIMFRSVLHWAAPLYDSLPKGVEKISSQHYWTIQGVNTDKANLRLNLHYELSDYPSSFDSTLFSSYDAVDSVILLYRSDINHPWVSIPFSGVTSNKGEAVTDFVHSGDYAFAKGDKSTVGLNEQAQMSKGIKIYPNPSDNAVNIYVKDWRNTVVSVYSLQGKQLDRIDLTGKNTVYRFKDKGTYILGIKTKSGVYSKTVIIK